MKRIDEKIDSYLTEDFTFDKKKNTAAKIQAEKIFNEMRTVLSHHMLEAKEECMEMISDVAEKDEEKYVLWALKNKFRTYNSVFFNDIEKIMTDKFDVEYSWARK